MDGQRQYPAEPDRWFSDRDHSGDDPGRSSARDDRYAGESRYDAPPNRYAALTEDSRYTPVIDRRDFGGYAEPTYEDRDAGRRRTEASPRSARVGKRSGLELPDFDMPDPTGGESIDPVGWDRIEEPPRFQTEVLDRGALRRPNTPTFESTPGYPPAPGPTHVVSPVSGPTHVVPPVPTQPASSVVYRPRRAGVAGLLALAGVVSELLLIRVLLSGEFASTVGGHDVLGGLFAMAGIPMVILGLYGLATGAASASGPNIGRAWLRTPLAYLPIGLVLLVAAGLAV